jgi:hypothetical protein
MNYVVNFLKWFTRILSILSLIVLLLIINENSTFRSFLAAQEVYDLFTFKDGKLPMFFPIGVFFGMAVSWWREGIGGFTALLSLITFYITEYIFTGMFPQGWAYALISSPALIFILYSVVTFNQRNMNAY